MSKLWQTRFFTTCNNFSDLPITQIPEIAFAGRSNTGKSTTINILCNQKKLAFTSKTPGRTQYINYFSIQNIYSNQYWQNKRKINEKIHSMLVDLPGYGYATTSKTIKLDWQNLLNDYIRQRTQLTALIMIVDIRRPFTDLDIQMIEQFSLTKKPLHYILNKADKLNNSEAINVLYKANKFLSNFINKNQQPLSFTIQLFSAIKRIGIEEANNRILKLIGLKYK